MNACMTDSRGRPVTDWLPNMQSSGFLRAMISKGVRTGECFTELKTRRERVHAGMRAIHGLDWQPSVQANT